MPTDPEVIPDPEGGKRRSAWMTHVKKTMRANKGKSLSQVLKMAKKTYKKTRRGGGAGMGPSPAGEGPQSTGGPAPVGGLGVTEGGRRRRRGSRKGSKKGSRRH
jgi:hypothetical protein